VKEIIYPLGATIDVRQIKLGDETMSVLEIWGAEYQENDALLIKPQARNLLEAVCARERCNLQVCLGARRGLCVCVSVRAGAAAAGGGRRRRPPPTSGIHCPPIAGRPRAFDDFCCW